MSRNRKKTAKRYEKFPELAAKVRAMSPNGVSLIKAWHTIMTNGLRGMIDQTRRELHAAGVRGKDMEMALYGLRAWLRTCEEVGAVLADPSAGDWCCARGALAYPMICPQHGVGERL